MTKITFKGKSIDLAGRELNVGDRIENFTVLANDLTPVTVDDIVGKVTIVSVIPSLDTGVCDAQTRRFNQEAAGLNGVEIYTVSVDLPFAQKRWCGAAGIDKVKTVSDHRDLSFGKAFGVIIEELRLLARAVFVLNEKGEVVYLEYVPEATDHPNYEAAIASAKTLL